MPLFSADMSQCSLWAWALCWLFSLIFSICFTSFLLLPQITSHKSCAAVHVHSVVSNSSAAPWTVAHQVLLSVSFSRQEYWVGLPFPTPWDLPNSAAATAAAAKSLQLCPALCDPIDGSPPGSPAPGILQARTLEWVAISFSNAGKWKVKVKLLSSVWLFTTPWTAAYQAPPSMGFSRQEYWSGVPLPSNSATNKQILESNCNNF